MSLARLATLWIFFQHAPQGGHVFVFDASIPIEIRNPQRRNRSVILEEILDLAELGHRWLQFPKGVLTVGNPKERCGRIVRLLIGLNRLLVFARPLKEIAANGKRFPGQFRHAYEFARQRNAL